MKPRLDILGGFLGAGKTETINRLLTAGTEAIGVIVNDFGAVNIDAALIARRGGNVIGLTNGCVCCALGDDLGGAIQRVLAAAPGLRRIVVEASGVSDPRRIAQIAQLERTIRVGRVITLVDAARFPDLLADRYLTDTLLGQIARADRILLTHVDLATAPRYHETLALLASHGIGQERIFLAGPEDGMCLSPITETAPAPHRRDGPFSAESCTSPPQEAAPHAPFWHWLCRAPAGSRAQSPSRAALEDWLRTLPPEILRVKGIVQLRDEAHPAIVHKAGPSHAIASGEGMEPRGLVMIGRFPQPDMERLEQDLSGLPAATPDRESLS